MFLILPFLILNHHVITLILTYFITDESGQVITINNNELTILFYFREEFFDALSTVSVSSAAAPTAPAPVVIAPDVEAPAPAVPVGTPAPVVIVPDVEAPALAVPVGTPAPVITAPVAASAASPSTTDPVSQTSPLLSQPPRLGTVNFPYF